MQIFRLIKYASSEDCNLPAYYLNMFFNMEYQRFVKGHIFSTKFQKYLKDIGMKDNKCNDPSFFPFLKCIMMLLIFYNTRFYTVNFGNFREGLFCEVS